MQHAVAALGQRLDDRGQRRHADPKPRVERDLDLRDGAQAPVDVRVGADHLDLEAGHAALADLVDRVRDAVHAADAVGHQRDPDRLVVARRELALLAPEEGGRGRVGDRGEAGGEDLRRGRGDLRRVGDRGRDRALQAALVVAARAALQIRVREAVGLQQRQQLGLAHPQVDRVQPGAQQRARVLRAEVAPDRPDAGVALDHHALDHPQHRGGIGRVGGIAAAQRADRERHRGVRPLGGRALLAVRADAAGADVGEELARRRRLRASPTRCGRCPRPRGRRSRRRRSRRASRRRSRPDG